MINVKDELDQASHDNVASLWAKHCIYRVPLYLREGDDKAIVPEIVSLPSRQEAPLPNGPPQMAFIELYLDSIKEVEEKARACYEGPVAMGLSSNEFVEKMVLDGCFVLELFRGAAEGFKQLGYPRNDPIFAMRGTMHSIQRDMIMLENQLPFFILYWLLVLQYGDPEQKGLVAKLDSGAIGTNSSHRLDTQPPSIPSEQGGLHCLDVFRRSLLRTGLQTVPRVWIKRWSHSIRVGDKRRQQLIHCVTELREAGIKFKFKFKKRLCKL
ncbi:unnamed protein product [Malus baccata var. baccata]